MRQGLIIATFLIFTLSFGLMIGLVFAILVKRWIDGRRIIVDDPAAPSLNDAGKPWTLKGPMDWTLPSKHYDPNLRSNELDRERAVMVRRLNKLEAAR